MREYLFRGFYETNYGNKVIMLNGKQIKGEWVEGNLFVGDDGKCEILIGTKVVRISYPVIPETVCEYTGFSDKNCVKIFEDSILYNTDQYLCEERYRKYIPIGYDQWKSGNDIYNIFELKDHIKDFEVIGNIFDNPKLLEGEE